MVQEQKIEGEVWRLVPSPDFKSVCRGAERSEVCSIRTLSRHSSRGGKVLNTFDLIILGLLFFGGIAGFQKGLITGLSRFVGKIAAIVIAVVFHSKFLETLEPVLSLREKVEPAIGGFLLRIVESKAPSGSSSATQALVQPAIGEATLALTDYVLKIGSLLVLFILASLVINLIIAVVITPLAKTLSFVDRGGGLAFGVLSMAIGLCLVVGLLAPFLTTASTGLFKTNNSLLYPWLIQGYDVILAVISTFAGDILSNPLDKLPMFNQTPI